MKIRIDNFKGTAPRVSDRSLQDGYAVVANTARLRSTDLEPYKEHEVVAGVDYMPYPVDFIYPMDADADDGGPFWLTWADSDLGAGQTSVDVARGFIKDDEDERTYFTGTDQPRVTDLPTATASSPYPDASYFLGVPSLADDTAYQVDALFDFSSITPTNYLDYDGGSLGEFEINNEDTNSTIVVANDVSGDYFQFLDGSSSNPSAINIQPVGETHWARIEFDLEYTDNTSPDIVLALGLDAEGNGDGIYFEYTGAAITGRFVKVNQYIPKSLLANGSTSIEIGASATVTVTISSATDNLLLEDNSRLVEISTDGGSTNDFTGNLVFDGYGWGFIGYLGTNPQEAKVRNIDVDKNGQDASLTNYVMTGINGYSEEGIPSIPSEDVLKSDDIEIALTLESLTGDFGATYNLQGKRVYRAATSSTGVTEYLLLDFSPATLTLGATSATDDIDDVDLGPDVLESFDWEKPPSDGCCITALSNGIMLIASGNTIYPSVAYRPHAYPTSYSVAVDDEIVAMTSFENQAVVMTQEGAYLLYGDDPSAMVLTRIPQRYGCASADSVVLWAGYGVVYASPDGLVAINGTSATLITESYITKREWTDFQPATIKAAVYDDVYYGWYGDGTQGFAFDPRKGEIGLISLNFDDAVTAVHTNPFDDTLYYISDDGAAASLVSFATNDSLYKTYTWKSKKYLLPYPMSFECGMVRGKDSEDADETVTLNLYANSSGTPFFTKTINITNLYEEFILPVEICKEIEIELIGKTTVYSVELAEMMEELA